MQNLSTLHRSQLTKKFQIAHFIVNEGHAFNFYSKLAHFERAEMVKYISKSMKVKTLLSH